MHPWNSHFNHIFLPEPSRKLCGFETLAFYIGSNLQNLHLVLQDPHDLKMTYLFKGLGGIGEEFGRHY
jgi:hypothetical protein